MHKRWMLMLVESVQINTSWCPASLKYFWISFGGVLAGNFAKNSQKIHVFRTCHVLQRVQVPWLVWITLWLTATLEVGLMVRQDIPRFFFGGVSVENFAKKPKILSFSDFSSLWRPGKKLIGFFTRWLSLVRPIANIDGTGKNSEIFLTVFRRKRSSTSIFIIILGSLGELTRFQFRKGNVNFVSKKRFKKHRGVWMDLRLGCKSHFGEV